MVVNIVDALVKPENAADFIEVRLPPAPPPNNGKKRSALHSAE